MSVVVITGSNSGIGLEAALAFGRRGDHVVATMRDIEKADELLSRAAAERINVEVKRLDVTRNDQFAGFMEAVVAENGGLDVLINNAGIHRGGALEDISTKSFREIIATNCVGPVLLARAALPTMRKQNSGLIIMMSSLSGIAGLPGDTPYAAGKFGLEGATEALRHEVDRWGIRVALVQAGLYRTSIMAHHLAEHLSPATERSGDSPYRPLIDWQLNQLRDRISAAPDPAIIARMFVTIADSKESRLRWPVDPMTEEVLATMLAQTDSERDEYLREISGCDWWSQGDEPPEK